MNAPPDETRDARRLAGAVLAGLTLAAGAISILTRSEAQPAPIAQRIDLNTADASLLTLLPNIGPARAAAIIADREANGPFNSLEDLTHIRGVGPRTIDELQQFVSPGAPGLTDKPN